MHKDEAAAGFSALSDSMRVKIVKFLYVKRDKMSYDELSEITGKDKADLDADIALLLERGLIIKNGDCYSDNKEYVDSLLDFIRTPCGCMHHN